MVCISVKVILLSANAVLMAFRQSSAGVAAADVTSTGAAATIAARAMRVAIVARILACNDLLDNVEF